ncbi:MAG: hypothetical protein AAF829_08610, partial [Pseudomonadota bacterium]
MVIDANGLLLTQEIVSDNGTPDDPDDDFTFTDFVDPNDDPLPPGAIAADICSDNIDPTQIAFIAGASLCESERSDISSIL